GPVGAARRRLLRSLPPSSSSRRDLQLLARGRSGTSVRLCVKCPVGWIALITRLFRQRGLFRMYLLVRKLFEVRILARERVVPASQRDRVRRSGGHCDACAAQRRPRRRGCV